MECRKEIWRAKPSKFDYQTTLAKPSVSSKKKKKNRVEITGDSAKILRYEKR